MNTFAGFHMRPQSKTSLDVKELWHGVVIPSELAKMYLLNGLSKSYSYCHVIAQISVVHFSTYKLTASKNTSLEAVLRSFEWNVKRTTNTNLFMILKEILFPLRDSPVQSVRVTWSSKDVHLFSYCYTTKSSH